MNEIVIGIVVGVAVALLGQFVAYLFEILKRKRDEHRRAKAVIKLILQELASHQSLYDHHLSWVKDSITKGGEQYKGYSFQPLRTEAYQSVFLPNWYVLPDKVMNPVTEYYSTVEPINILSGSFGTPTPVPIVEVRVLLENAREKARELKAILQK